MRYDVELERDESGAWLATVSSVPGCHSYGRSLRQTKGRIREALALWVDDSDEAELNFRYKLPPKARTELHRVQVMRERAGAAQHEARLATRRAVHRLSLDMGLSVRDTADLLGLSHQRVQQLLAPESRGDAGGGLRKAASA